MVEFIQLTEFGMTGRRFIIRVSEITVVESEWNEFSSITSTTFLNPCKIRLSDSSYVVQETAEQVCRKMIGELE